MFAGRFASSTGLIGIDFGSRGVKMLQVREKKGMLQVVGAARIDIPLPHLRADEAANPQGPGALNDHVVSGASYAGDQRQMPVSADAGGGDIDPLAQQIRAAFTSGGFRGARCVVSLAREDVCLQSIRLPKMSDDELRQTAVWEASQRFGFDRNAMQVDFIRTGAMLQSGENREEVILIAAPHAAIAARVEPVLSAGLRPVAVDAGFSALVRAFSRHARRESDRANVRTVVEVGESGSTVLILRGDQVAFCKPIAIGGSHFNQAVAEHLQMDVRQAAELRANRIAATTAAWDEKSQSRKKTTQRIEGANADIFTPDASLTADPATDRAVYEAVRPLMGDLIKEVTLCLRYYGVTFRGHPPDHIILTGGDGLEPRLAEVMANACKTPVVLDDPSGALGSMLPGIRASLSRTPGPAAAWAVALGLSLRGIRKSDRANDRKLQATARSQPNADARETADLRSLAATQLAAEASRRSAA